MHITCKTVYITSILFKNVSFGPMRNLLFLGYIIIFLRIVFFSIFLNFNPGLNKFGKQYSYYVTWMLSTTLSAYVEDALISERPLYTFLES